MASSEDLDYEDGYSQGYYEGHSDGCFYTRQEAVDIIERRIYDRKTVLSGPVKELLKELAIEIRRS